MLHFAASRPHGKSAFYRLVSESGCSLADRDEEYRTPRDIAEQHNLWENVKAIDKWVINLAAQGEREREKREHLSRYLKHLCHTFGHLFHTIRPDMYLNAHILRDTDKGIIHSL